MIFLINENNLSDQSNIILYLERVMKEETTLPKVNLKKYLKNWYFYLAHQTLYCRTYFSTMSYKSIRGENQL